MSSPVRAATAASTSPTAGPETHDGYRWVKQDCPICGKPPHIYLGRRGGPAHRAGLGVESHVWRCRDCGLVFANPMPVPLGGVEQHYALDPDEYFKQHNSELKLDGALQGVRHAESLVGKRGRLLDIGAGRGEMLAAARQAGWEAVGIEPSDSFAAHAEKNSGAEVRREPIEHCGFASESFDAVILSGVLEHLYNPDETIQEIARVLRPGGALFVDVPNEVGLYFRVGNFYQKLRGRDWVVNVAPTFEPFHVFGFGPKSLRALLQKHGLQVREWRVYAGTSMVPDRGGVLGSLEQAAARAVTAVSSLGQLGAYIETWAIKN